MTLNADPRRSERVWAVAVVLVCVFSTSFCYAGDAPSFGLAGFGGLALASGDEGVDGYPETEWEDGTVYGGSLTYRGKSGITFELMYEKIEMELVEGSAKFGTLEMTPIILMLGYQSLPVQQKGVAFHASIGGGIASSEFEEGKFIKDLEASSGENIDISQDDAFMFELGAGLDYFFTKNIALLLDFRWLIGTIDSDWDFGAGGTENYTFNVSNIQLVGGVRLWF